MTQQYTNHTPTAEDILSGGGNSIPAFKFPTVGTVMSGTVTTQSVMQQREFSANGPGKPMFWDDGSPRMQVVINVDLDNGEQSRVFIKGQMLQASKRAIAAAGLTSFVPGCKVTIKYAADKKTPSGFKAKQYEVTVVAPSKSQDEQAAVESVMSSEPEDKPAAPKASDLSPEAVEALRKAGLL